MLRTPGISSGLLVTVAISAVATIAVTVLCSRSVIADPLTTAYSFSAPSSGVNADGYDINCPIVVDAKGNMYGTAADGGSNGSGTIFKAITHLTK